MRSPGLLIATIGLGLTACGSGTLDRPAGTGPTGGGTETTLAPPAKGETVLVDTEIEGASVKTLSALDPLPERATVVRFTAMVIDSGDGPELCLSGVADSLPPQCAGPVIEELAMDSWAESQGGVSWGDRTVTVSWPPVDGHLTLVSDEPPLRREPIADGTSGLNVVPEGCDALARPVDGATLAAYAAAHPSLTDHTRAIGPQGSITVLRVVAEHLDEVRAELSAGGAEPCLEAVRYSSTELEAAQQAVFAMVGDGGIVLSGGSGNIFNRVTVDVAVADRASIKAVVSTVDDPGMLRIVGVGEILDGA